MADLSLIVTDALNTVEICFGSCGTGTQGDVEIDLTLNDAPEVDVLLETEL